MSTLSSYLAGRWIRPTAESTPLRDAVTGEEVARVAPPEADLREAIGYGRRVGGRAVQELTFHQRGLLLKQLALHLREQRDELYALSARSGATRFDAKFDVDGGIGVLFSYSDKGRREFPNDTVYVDGALEPLGTQGTFGGQHVYTSLGGIAVQINAFNFPVWGPLEKFAPAFLAGLPSLIKPASPTAYLTHRLVELVVNSGILPEGTIQLLCGGGRDLLNHLSDQDTVGFTGSASTAQRLRTHRAVVEDGVRFNSEADSLNCSILGPDADPETAEFELFVQQLVTEMTVKAGQKCTAIRRAIVPEPLMDAVAEATADRLAQVVIGNPTSASVGMGALASLEQREEVCRSLKALLQAGQLVHGDPDRCDVVDADAERGAFLPPLLLRCDDPDLSAPHEVEAFGPVSTLLPYTGGDHAIELARRSRGSLVGSVVSGDPAFARHVVLGAASRHGRMLVLNSRDDAESTGHGSPVPVLTHGGPGRAGGGEELGGIRGVLHHMQRTAIQGDPDTLTAITGRWVRGAERRTGVPHPFRKVVDDLRIGDTIVGGPRTITMADIEHFAEFTGDRFYAHLDEEAAAANPFFDSRVAHGYLLISFAAGLFVDPDPGPVLANYGLENLRFLAPAYPGDAVTVTLSAKQITPRPDKGYGEVCWDAEVTNQRDEAVATYDVLTLVAMEGHES